ncbi:hypothetical protein H7F15_18205 [Pontibacter sp. Tf4]|uniref:hypothetical protein n=1 Tax=Pontibacter sp. Tf4 TaxID=2761620 RepID=UPI001626B5CD|nr:hypothetical protein [Pontibacter sp. Tf4]MBB6612980.1 hypothetical protein [Pontibacter sp. Tf4]
MRYLLCLSLLILLQSCSDKNAKTAENHIPEQATTTVPTPDTATRTTQPIVEKPTPDTTFLILPGQRIGQVSLGQTAEQVSNILGKPDSGDAAMGKALSYWFGKNRKNHVVAVYFSRSYTEGPEDNLLVRQVRVNSSAFKTPESLGAGSPIATIRQHYTIAPIAYYQSGRQRIYIFDDMAKGIAFETAVSDSSCIAVTIHQAGEDVTNSYLPMHPDMTRL